MLPPHIIRGTATLLRKEAEARREAEAKKREEIRQTAVSHEARAEAGLPETDMGVPDETPRVEAEIEREVTEVEMPRAGAEAQTNLETTPVTEDETERAKKRKAVAKAKKKTRAEKRSRLESPAGSSPQRREAIQRTTIDLTNEATIQPPLSAAPDTDILPTATTIPIETPESRAETQTEAEPRGKASVSSDANEDEVLSLRSVLDKGKWAERTVSQICLPNIEKSLLSQGSSSFFRDVFAAQLWTANSLATLKKIMAQAEAALSESRESADAERSRADTAEKEMGILRLEKAKANTRAEKAEAELMAQKEKIEAFEEVQAARAEAEARAKNAEVEAQVRSERLDKVRAARADAEARMKNAEAEAILQKERAEKAIREMQAAEQKSKAMELDLHSTRGLLHAAQLDVKTAEERAENAEEIARRCDMELAEIQAALDSEKAMAEAAKKAATEAVGNYRQSAEYTKELAMETCAAYDLGFQDCKMKAKQVFGLVGIESLEPDAIDLDTAPTNDVPPRT